MSDPRLAELLVTARAGNTTVDAILTEGARLHLFGPPVRPGGQAELIFGEGDVQYAADEDDWSAA